MNADSSLLDVVLCELACPSVETSFYGFPSILLHSPRTSRCCLDISLAAQLVKIGKMGCRPSISSEADETNVEWRKFLLFNDDLKLIYYYHISAAETEK